MNSNGNGKSNGKGAAPSSPPRQRRETRPEGRLTPALDGRKISWQEEA
jgi:hypothetical protein